MSGKESVEEVSQKFESQRNVYQGMLNEVILGEIGVRDTAQQAFDPATAPAGTERADGTGVIWIKREDGQWETK